MAADIFLKMSPIKGESRDSKHKDEIEVLGWSWGATNKGSAHRGGGAGLSKVEVHDLTLQKYADTSSTDLYLACCSGKHFDEALLTVRKAGGDNPVEYMKITMNEVFVSKIESGPHLRDSDHLTENVSLNFAKVKVESPTGRERGRRRNDDHGLEHRREREGRLRHWFGEATLA